MANSKESFYSYSVTYESKTGTSITYKIGASAGRTPAYSTTIYDDIQNGPNDSSTQVGDVNNDQYHEVSAGLTQTGVFVGGTANHLTFVGANQTSGTSYLYTNSTYTPGSYITVTNSPNNATTITCFAQGTLIRTAHGDMAVETLSVGDIVVTASGDKRPIRWLGHRTIDCRAQSASDVMPIRVSAHAFGANRPARDLYVSPEHSLCVNLVEEVLIPAYRLLNGSTIAQVEVDTVTYWHVEFDTHDIILAENMPTESFLEMGENRGLLGVSSAKVSEEVRARTHTDFCRPFLDSGPVLDVVRMQLAARAERLGWTPVQDPELSGVADSVPLHPQIAGGEAFFVVPNGTRNLRLRSAECVPLSFGGQDPRRIGLAVYAIALTDVHGITHTLDLDAPSQRDNFHNGERQEGLHYRWTRGDLVVPAEILSPLEGPLLLRLTFEPSTIRGWAPPPGTMETLPKARLTLRVVA